MALLQADGIWTWFNGPVAFYDAERDCTYIGWLTANGTPYVGKYYHSSGIWHARALRAVMQADDHNNAVPLMVHPATSANGGKILAGYSRHVGGAHTRLSATQRGIASVGTELTMADASRSYMRLFQMADDNRTIYQFYRNDGAATRSQMFQTSTDGGATWSSAITLYEITNRRPYPQMVQSGPNTLEFTFSDDSASDDPTASTRHFSMEVASDGTRTFYTSDGTLIGDDDDLPLGTGDVTLIYDGSTTGSLVWDICVVEGVLTVLFVTFADSGSEHYYWRAQWNGSAWVTEQICNGGDVEPHSIVSAAEIYYSGGICADPYDTESVFVGRVYGTGDSRIEKWTKSGGTWAKTVDVSGNTGSVNARPMWVRGYPTTQILYWRGTYTDFTDYLTDIHSYPDLTVNTTYTPVVKPATPVWQPDFAPEGALGLWPITEGSGTTVANLVPSGTNGNFVNSPTWGTGSYGPQLGGFSTTAYVPIDPPSQLLATGVYPFWMASMQVNSSSAADGYPVSQGRSTIATPVVSLAYTAAGAAISFVRSDGNVNVTLSAAGQPVADGNHHVLMYVAWAANDHKLYMDGIQVQTGTGSLGTVTNDRLTIGALRRNTVTLPFLGSVGMVACGRSGVPDPGELAHDWLNGDFSAIRATGYSLSIDSGIFTLTGSAVSLEVGRKAIIEAGTYDLVGTSVLLEHGSVIAIEAGTYNLTGSDVTLVHSGGNPVISIGTGVYTITGSAVSLRANHRVLIASASYTLTGQAITLRLNHTVVAGTGIYSLTGAVINLRAASRLVVGSGIYNQAGSDITFIHTPAGSGNRTSHYYAMMMSDYDEVEI